jgi:hypothetical protein
MNPLTPPEINKGIAFRQGICYEICGDCNQAFEKGLGKLGYGFTNEPDHKGVVRYPNGHPADGRGRCSECLKKRGAFDKRRSKPGSEGIRDLVLGAMSRRGATVKVLAKDLRQHAADIEQALAQLVEEGRIAKQKGLYFKRESEVDSDV